MQLFIRNLTRLLWCAFGAALAIGIALFVMGMAHAPFLLASLGGSTVFLFGLTRAPAAQPRALLGGHFGGALIGITCYQLFGDALWVYVVAQVVTLIYMMLTQTMHPPAGANPLLMIHAHANFSALLIPVGSGVLILALTAVVWSRLWPDMQTYPANWNDKSPPTPLWGGWD